jgi:hypothetical protein
MIHLARRENIFLWLAQLCLMFSSSHLVAVKEQKDGVGEDVELRSESVEG